MSESGCPCRPCQPQPPGPSRLHVGACVAASDRYWDHKAIQTKIPGNNSPESHGYTQPCLGDQVATKAISSPQEFRAGEPVLAPVLVEQAAERPNSGTARRRASARSEDG